MSHVRIGVYAVTSGTVKEVADRAREGMLSVFRAQPGFRAYGLAETQEGKVVSVSMWDSADQAQQANELAASWVSENLADRVRLEGTHVGDFSAARHMRPPRRAGERRPRRRHGGPGTCPCRGDRRSGERARARQAPCGRPAQTARRSVAVTLIISRLGRLR